MHTVEHLINPLAMQHPEHSPAAAAATAAAATVLPAVSTPPPFQVGDIHGVKVSRNDIQIMSNLVGLAGQCILRLY